MNSRRWWGTGRPGVLQSMGLQRLGHNLAMNNKSAPQLRQSSLMLVSSQVSLIPAWAYHGFSHHRRVFIVLEQYMYIYVWLQSMYSFESVLFLFKVMFTWFIHTVAHNSSSVIFIAQFCSTLWLHPNLAMSKLKNTWDAFSFYLLQIRFLWAFY